MHCSESMHCLLLCNFDIRFSVFKEALLYTINQISELAQIDDNEFDSSCPFKICFSQFSNETKLF